jgi:hypothetical protein
MKTPMFDVYEVYGSRVADLRDVRSLLSHALGVVFEYHESYYLGEYFLASGPSGQKLTIESNQLEDEDGRYSQETEFSEYKTLVRLEYCAPSRVDDGPAPDELSHRLGNLEDLILLQRNFVPAEK